MPYLIGASVPDALALLPAAGAPSDADFVGALRRLHEQRPQTAMVLEIGATTARRARV